MLPRSQADRLMLLAVAGAVASGAVLYTLKDRAKDAYHAIKYVYLSRSLWKPTIKDYVEVKCPEGAVVIGVFGQSNSANFVFPRYNKPIPGNLYQLDWKSGRCYKYKEPLLSADGLGGSTITHFATLLSQDTQSPILIVPFGQGGSSAHDWSDGFLAERHERVLEEMAAKNLNPVVFFWHQGEMGAGTPANFEAQIRVNASPESLAEKAYQTFMTRIIEKTRRYYPDSYFGIAHASLCKGKPYEPIRSAQRRVAQQDKKNFLSADSDQINGPTKRYDGCHFSQAGALELGLNYYTSFSRAIQQDPIVQRKIHPNDGGAKTN